MRSRSCLSFQPLTIPAPWVILFIGWSITMVSTLVTASRFLAGNRLSWNPQLSLLLLSRVFFPLLPPLPPQRYIVLSAASSSIIIKITPVMSSYVRFFCRSGSLLKVFIRGDLVPHGSRAAWYSPTNLNLNSKFLSNYLLPRSLSLYLSIFLLSLSL